MRAMLTMGAVLLALCAVALADDLTLERRKELEKKAQELGDKAYQQYQLGKVIEARELLREVVATYRALYPSKDYAQGHPDLARGLNSLANLHQAAGEYAKAEPLFREVLATYRALYPGEHFPQGHADLARSINNLATLHQHAGEYAKAEPLFREALD